MIELLLALSLIPAFLRAERGDVPPGYSTTFQCAVAIAQMPKYKLRQKWPQFADMRGRLWRESGDQYGRFPSTEIYRIIPKAIGAYESAYADLYWGRTSHKMSPGILQVVNEFGGHAKEGDTVPEFTGRGFYEGENGVVRFSTSIVDLGSAVKGLNVPSQRVPNARQSIRVTFNGKKKSVSRDQIQSWVTAMIKSAGLEDILVEKSSQTTTGKAFYEIFDQSNAENDIFSFSVQNLHASNPKVHLFIANLRKSLSGETVRPPTVVTERVDVPLAPHVKLSLDDDEFWAQLNNQPEEGRGDRDSRTRRRTPYRRERGPIRIDDDID